MAEAVFKVVKVLNAMELVVNAGATDGIKRGDTFVVYQLDEEITDPESGESLGRLERLRGTGEAVHVQERMTTVRSSERELQRLDRSSYGFRPSIALATTAESGLTAPFVSPAVGDLARKL